MSPTTTIPDQLRYLFDEPALAHVSYLNRRGHFITFPMWVDFDGQHILVSSPVGSRKGNHFGSASRYRYLWSVLRIPGIGSR